MYNFLSVLGLSKMAVFEIDCKVHHEFSICNQPKNPKKWVASQLKKAAGSHPLRSVTILYRYYALSVLCFSKNVKNRVKFGGVKFFFRGNMKFYFPGPFACTWLQHLAKVLSFISASFACTLSGKAVFLQKNWKNTND